MHVFEIATAFRGQCVAFAAQPLKWCVEWTHAAAVFARASAYVAAYCAFGYVTAHFLHY